MTSSHVEDSDRKLAVDHLEFADMVVNDVAADYVDPTLEISEAENTILRHRIHRRVLPLLCLGYLCQALDKGTTSSASIMGWLSDINAVGQDYSLTGTLLWCGILLGEPWSNQLIRRLPHAKLLAGGIYIWSALLFGLAFSFSVPPVLAIRFLLGLFESLVGPVLLVVTVQWYRVSEQPFVTTCWQAMLGFSNIINSLLAYGFYHIGSGSLRSWQWLNISVALVSLVSATLILLFLPDSPTQARWASEDDKKRFVERCRANNQGIKQKKWKGYQAKEAFTDPMSACLFLLCVFNTMVVGGIGTFGSLLVVKAFGFSVLEAQLLNIPVGIIGILTFLLIGFLVKKTGQTLYTMIGFTVPNIVGTVVLLTVTPTSNTRVGLLVAYYMMQVFGACYPAVLFMLSRNSAGQTKKSITYAITFMGWASGNAVAPQLFRAKWAPRYRSSLYIHLALYSCFIITCLVTRGLLMRRNKLKVDAAEARSAVQGDAGVANLHAFEDLTDLENPDFRYSY